MPIFSNTPTCVSKQTTVSGCLDKVHFFDRAYALGDKSRVDCEGNKTASRLREFAIYDTIVCGEGEDMNMFSLVDMMFGANDKGIPSTSVWRDTWCRPDYSFKIKNGATQGIGQPVTVELDQSAYSLDGNAAIPVKGSPINLPGKNYPIGIISDIDTTPFHFKITIRPAKKNQAISLKDGQRLFPQPGARLVTGGSCPVEQTSAPLPGKLQRVQMAKIRADWCIEKELNEGYDGVLQFAPAPVVDERGNLKVVECWDAVAAQMARKSMKMTRDQLLLVGRYIDNPDPAIVTQILGYEGFEGYIPSVLNGGGIDYEFDPFTGLDVFQALRQFARFAEANRRCREWTWYVSPEFRRGITDSWNNRVKAVGLGICTYDAFSKTGLSQEQISEYLGYDSLKVDSVTIHLKTVEALADNTAYGISGYSFNNMAMAMPGCAVRTVSGATVPPIEIFYPETACATGGYEEFMIDYRKTNGCQKIGGYMIQAFAAMFHCVEDHAVMRASICQ